MTYGKKPASVSDIYTFSEVVDKACEQLMDRQIKYSIRRIQAMDERLAELEKELDDFLSHRNRKK
jgi:transposase